MPEPSAPTIAADAAAAAVAPDAAPSPSADTTDSAPKSRGWLEPILSKFRVSPTDRSGDAKEDARDGDADAPTTNATDLSAKALREMTDAELDQVVQTDERVRRRVQAETDRRESKRQAEQAAKSARDSVAARQQKLEAMARPSSGEFDPWTREQEIAKDEQIRTATEAYSRDIERVATTFDQAVLDPLMERVPDAERSRILGLDGAGVGWQGRSLIVRESLDVLLKAARAEGAKAERERIRKDPVTRKLALVDRRADEDEPDDVPAANGAPRGADMNAWIRGARGHTSSQDIRITR